MQLNLVKDLVVVGVVVLVVAEGVDLVVEVVVLVEGLLVVEVVVVVAVVDLVAREVAVEEVMEVVMVVVSKSQDMEVVMVGDSLIQVMEVVMVVVERNSKVVMAVVSSNSKVVMMVVMVVNNRMLVEQAQAMILSLKDMAPNHLLLIPTTKVMIQRHELHRLAVMELLQHQVMVVLLLLVAIKDTQAKVRGTINLKHQLLHILLEVVHMHRLRNNHNNNMVANLHMELVLLVDKLKVIMHNQPRNTHKDRVILRLHQVTETLVLGTSKLSH